MSPNRLVPIKFNKKTNILGLFTKLCLWRWQMKAHT